MALFVAVVPSLYSRPRTSVLVEMQVALPRFAQVIMSGGDRFFAANLAGFRTLIASTENMGPENYRIQGVVQSDVAWFNGAHEDNYYIAAAILPWNGQVAAAQTVLRRASDARPFDMQPAFFYGFNALHFLKRPVEAGEWLLVAANHSQDENERLQLQNLATLWIAKGEDKEFAIRLHRLMAKESKHKGFADHLEKRALRLENLLALDCAIDRYNELEGHRPTRLKELVDSHMLAGVPQDPFGERYIIGADGKAQVAPATVVPEKSERKSHD
ncbi:MAG TPA: hypothetical protein VFF03_11385 [Rhodocyclaceae bacterium]|nr:hypothetical protein [Rhodocyclaceae bacterium]